MAKIILFLVVLLIRKKIGGESSDVLRSTDWLRFIFFPLFTIFTVIALIITSGSIENQKQENVSGKFSELAEILRRDKRASDKVKFVEVCNPFRILFVRFLSFDGFDIFGMCEADIDIIFEIIKNRNPILSSGFHTNMIAIILDKPVVKPLNI